MSSFDCDPLSGADRIVPFAPCSWLSSSFCYLALLHAVVALFNAISKARATAQAEAETATTKKIKTSSGTSHHMALHSIYHSSQRSCRTRVRQGADREARK
jgi:hypothetical protein